MMSKIVKEDIENLAESLIDLRDRFENKTFLITGAGGFLGNYMVLLLKYLNDHVLTNPASGIFVDKSEIKNESRISEDHNLRFIRHNVIEQLEIDNHIDYIIHAAGIASPLHYVRYPLETIDVATTGTRNMLELARKKNVKGFIFTSSSEVYGDPDNNNVPTPETYNGNVSLSGPRACYEESKRFGEILCRQYYEIYGVPVKIVRYFNSYGPEINPNDSRVILNFINNGITGKALMVHGDGKNTRSYCYINDTIEATMKLLISENIGEAYNIGNPSSEISTEDLAELISNGIDEDVEIVKGSLPHEVYGEYNPKRRCPDISKLKSSIDFSPRYSLDDGLKRTIEWYREKIVEVPLAGDLMA